MIPQDVTRDLRRLSELAALQARDGDNLAEYAKKEIVTLRRPIAELFVPLMKMLTVASVVQVSIRDTGQAGEVFASDVEVVTGSVSKVLINDEATINLCCDGVIKVSQTRCDDDDNGEDDSTCKDQDCDFRKFGTEDAAPLQNNNTVQMTPKSQIVH